MKRNYDEKLTDPRWQRKRLEIMRLHDFKCAECNAGDKELHVHHSYYVKGREPWDYPNWSLVCLCHNCHEDEHLELDRGALMMFETVLSKICGWHDGVRKLDNVIGDLFRWLGQEQFNKDFWQITRMWKDSVWNRRFEEQKLKEKQDGMA